MRNLNQDTITEAVLARFANTPDPRLKEIISSLVTHLHNFARDVKLTEEEWFYGIQYLTATGHKCTDVRQEFILLSDVLGLSMLPKSYSYHAVLVAQPSRSHPQQNSQLVPCHAPCICVVAGR